MKKTVKYLLTGLAIQAMPFIASAAVVAGQSGGTFTMKNILDLLANILTWAITAIGIFALLGILYSAFLFLTSAGDEEKVTKAKKALLYSVIGAAVAILAFFVEGFIKNLIGV